MILSGNRNVIKAFVFVLIIVVLFFELGYFFQPTFGRENNYMAKKAFNYEPENTIDTIIIGSSTVHHGISVMEMYKENGICAWNMGSSLQPVSSSYYLLMDAYKLQGKSLKTVMFEVFMMDRNADDSLRRSINDAIMHYDIKYTANREYAKSIKDALDRTIPLSSYHSRWSEISKSDFNKSYEEYRAYLRGYYLDTNRNYFYEHDYTEITLPAYNADFSGEDARFTAESLFYLRKMIDFCDDHDIKLVLFKTPMAESWDVSRHNAVQDIADQYGLDFLDFNYEPLFDEISYNYATDQSDGDHMNYYGVKKLSAWIGDYLVKECGAEDVRGKVDYDFLEEEYRQYEDKVEGLVAMRDLEDPADYIEAAVNKGKYTILISVKDDASASLSESQRKRFEAAGLTRLADLGFRDSYLAVIDPVEGIIHEELDRDPEDEEEQAEDEQNLELMESVSLDYVEKERESVVETENSDSRMIEYKNNLSDGGFYSIKSGGANLGHTASILVDGEEYAADERGLNIVIYDNDLHEVSDSTVFDTCAYQTRLGNDLETELKKALSEDPDPKMLSGDLDKLYKYNELCKAERMRGNAKQDY